MKVKLISIPQWAAGYFISANCLGKIFGLFDEANRLPTYSLIRGGQTAITKFRLGFDININSGQRQIMLLQRRNQTGSWLANRSLSSRSRTSLYWWNRSLVWPRNALMTACFGLIVFMFIILFNGYCWSVVRVDSFWIVLYISLTDFCKCNRIRFSALRGSLSCRASMIARCSGSVSTGGRMSPFW